MSRFQVSRWKSNIRTAITRQPTRVRRWRPRRSKALVKESRLHRLIAVGGYGFVDILRSKHCRFDFFSKSWGFCTTKTSWKSKLRWSFQPRRRWRLRSAVECDINQPNPPVNCCVIVISVSRSTPWRPTSGCFVSRNIPGQRWVLRRFHSTRKE